MVLKAGAEQPTEKEEGGALKAEFIALYRGTADISNVNVQMDYPIHCKGFIEQGQETLVTSTENLEQFYLVW